MTKSQTDHTTEERSLDNRRSKVTDLDSAHTCECTGRCCKGIASLKKQLSQLRTLMKKNHRLES